MKIPKAYQNSFIKRNAYRLCVAICKTFGLYLNLNVYHVDFETETEYVSNQLTKIS